MQRHRKRWQEEPTIGVSRWLGERTWDHATGIPLKPTRATPIFSASRFNREALVVNVRGVCERLQCFLSPDAIWPARLQTSRTGGASVRPPQPVCFLAVAGRARPLAAVDLCSFTLFFCFIH